MPGTVSADRVADVLLTFAGTGGSLGVSEISRRLGLHRSQRIVAKLSALFALDAFGGGFVIASLIAFWFSLRFGSDGA